MLAAQMQVMQVWLGRRVSARLAHVGLGTALFVRERQRRAVPFARV